MPTVPPILRGRLVLAPLALLAACGGTTPSPARIPAAERAVVRHLPADAWSIARLDARALRAAPHYAPVHDMLAREDRAAASVLEGMDVAYVAVGGFRPVPHVEDESGEVPDYVRKAERLGGKLPHVVVALVGPTADEFCEVPRLEHPGPELHGFRTGQNDEFAIAVGADVCLMTFVPFLEETLAGHDGVADVFSALGPIGSPSLYVSGATQLESQGYRDLLTAIAADVPDDRSGRFVRYLELVFAGVQQVSGTVSRTDGHYRATGHLTASDAGRGVMWREITELTLQLLDATFEGVDDPEAALARRVVQAWSVVETGDGYEARLEITDEVLADIVQSMEAGATSPIEHSASVAEPWLVMGGGARANLEAYDAHVAEHGRVRDDQLIEVELTRARSLAQLARYDEARRALEALGAAIDAEGSGFGETERARQALATCEVALAAGDLDAALAAGARAVERADYGDTLLGLDARRCRARAFLGKGDRGAAEGELAEAETRYGSDALGLEVARAELELAAGHSDVALAITRALCAQRSYLGECIDALALACEARLATTPMPADTVASCRLVLERSEGGGLREEAAHLRAAVGACEAAVARRSEDVPSVCDDAAARIRDAGAEATEFALRLARARASHADLRGATDEARELRDDAARIERGLPATHRARVSAPPRAGAAGSTRGPRAANPRSSRR